jgi:hypothetical protein
VSKNIDVESVDKLFKLVVKMFLVIVGSFIFNVEFGDKLFKFAFAALIAE